MGRAYGGSITKRPGRAPGAGRPKGVPNPDGLEWIRRARSKLYDALLNSALAGDADAIRLCLELTGEYPQTNPPPPVPSSTANAAA